MKKPAIILHQTSHPGNIGACARAMKTMALSELRLVSPHAKLNCEAYQRASHATDVLDATQSYADLSEACADLHWVIACTARPRHLQWPVLTPKEAAHKAHTILQAGQSVAFVFGNERTGLPNEAFRHMQAIVEIPTNPQYRSLNLAHAVQILAYEYHITQKTPSKPIQERAEQAACQHLFDHLHRTLNALDFFPHGNPKHTMAKLMCLLNRAELSCDEVALLRGLLTAMDKHIPLESES